MSAGKVVFWGSIALVVGAGGYLVWNQYKGGGNGGNKDDSKKDDKNGGNSGAGTKGSESGVNPIKYPTGALSLDTNKILYKGMPKNDEVSELQKQLGAKIDGWFGDETEKKLIAKTKAWGLGAGAGIKSISLNAYKGYVNTHNAVNNVFTNLFHMDGMNDMLNNFAGDENLNCCGNSYNASGLIDKKYPLEVFNPYILVTQGIAAQRNVGFRRWIPDYIYGGGQYKYYTPYMGEIPVDHYGQNEINKILKKRKLAGN